MKNVLPLVLVCSSLIACVSSSKDAPSPGGTPFGDGGIAVLSGAVCGNYQLDGAQTIPAGQTVSLCAGTTLTATGPQASIVVQGTLTILGTASAPVRLLAAGAPAGWQGLDIQRGGSVSRTYLEIHDAAVGLSTRAGSMFDLDHLVIDDSSQIMQLASSGTLAHGALHGLGGSQSSSPVFIDQASPTITDTVIDKGQYGGVDNIIVEGMASAPVFDHVEVADSHCAFHFNQGTGITITNSFVHHNAYGLMTIDSTGSQILHNNFEDESVNIGACATTSATVQDNFFAGAPFDGSCIDAGLAVSGTAPPMAYTTDVGPRM